MYVSFFFYIILILFLFIIINNLSTFEYFSNNMTFSNTDKWGYQEKQLLDKLTSKGKKIIQYIPDIPFPTNLSYEAKEELKHIKHLQLKVNENIKNEIHKEIYLNGMLDRFQISSSDREKIISFLTTEIDPIIMNLKKKYNRVRPYHLDKTIIPIIEPPEHPSYPSGHATQSFTIAYLLSEKYPNKKDFFNTIANKISKNREYAGVHYKSDTKFGNIVAKKLFEYFSNEKNPLL